VIKYCAGHSSVGGFHAETHVQAGYIARNRKTNAVLMNCRTSEGMFIFPYMLDTTITYFMYALFCSTADFISRLYSLFLIYVKAIV